VDGNGELDFAEFAVMWAPYVGVEAGTPAAAAPEMAVVDGSDGQARKPMARGKPGSRKGVQIDSNERNGAAHPDADPAAPAVPAVPTLKRQQSSMSNKLTTLVSSSFAKKVKQSKHTFSFRRRASSSLLFGSRKSASSSAANEAGPAAANEGRAPSVLFMAGAVEGKPQASAAPTGSSDAFLSALEQAEQRDLDSQRRLESTDGRAKLLSTTTSEAAALSPPAPPPLPSKGKSSNGSPQGSSSSKSSNGSSHGGSAAAGLGKKRVSNKAVVLATSEQRS
jgi:hypothetical protein